MTDFRIEGLDAILKRMHTLPDKLQKKGVRSAGRKAMAIVRKAAVTRAKQFDDKRTSQQIWKEIVVRSKKSKKPGEVVLQVGVRGGAKKYVNSGANRRAGRVGGSYEGGGNVYHWRFLEFGTSKMRAQPFMRPALANNVGKVTDTFVANLNTEIDKALR